jgi:hypothetical protein
MGKNINGYGPKRLKRFPKKPTNAEPEKIRRVYNFSNKLDFKKLGINWNNGKRGPKVSEASSLLGVWLFGYQNGINQGRALEKELYRNKDLQYLSKGFLFSDTILNKFRRR